MTYVAAADRYESMPYRRCGRSGLKLPAVSLGLWHNFGGDRPLETQREILRRAISLSARMCSRFSSLSQSGDSEESRAARESAGMPSR
jgi:L-glyceraldehyde 3-phosphate reductase